MHKVIRRPGSRTAAWVPLSSCVAEVYLFLILLHRLVVDQVSDVQQTLPVSIRLQVISASERNMRCI